MRRCRGENETSISLSVVQIAIHTREHSTASFGRMGVLEDTGSVGSWFSYARCCKGASGVTASCVSMMTVFSSSSQVAPLLACLPYSTTAVSSSERPASRADASRALFFIGPLHIISSWQSDYGAGHGRSAASSLAEVEAS